MQNKKDIVYFVGAGPGDRGLITVKGSKLLSLAEVILYDNLINTGLLDSCSPTAEKISVGKTGGEPSLTQEEINRILLEKAQDGKCVVRLKGGDPFLFGRGGEEAFGWLLYPVLALGGLKLLTEDLRVSTAGTLFLALACLGAALILAPRLLRTARSSQ